MSTPRLLTDAMLGRLTTYLRMLGYDTAYVLERTADPDDDRIADIAMAEGRLLLTRDEPLAGRVEGLLIESTSIDGQLRELYRAGFNLTLDEPKRCSRCNGPLERVPPADPTPSFAPDAADETVWRCSRCEQPYWKGSHWDDVAERLRTVRQVSETDCGSEA